VIPPARDVDAALRRKVAESRAKQGLPPTITDPATLERVAAVLRLVAIPEPAPPLPRTPPSKNSTRASTRKTRSSCRDGAAPEIAAGADVR
jgi:hypothetical protein